MIMIRKDKREKISEVLKNETLFDLEMKGTMESVIKNYEKNDAIRMEAREQVSRFKKKNLLKKGKALLVSAGIIASGVGVAAATLNPVLGIGAALAIGAAMKNSVAPVFEKDNETGIAKKRLSAANAKVKMDNKIFNEMVGDYQKFNEHKNPNIRKQLYVKFQIYRDRSERTPVPEKLTDEQIVKKSEVGLKKQYEDDFMTKVMKKITGADEDQTTVRKRNKLKLN